MLSSIVFKISIFVLSFTEIARAHAALSWPHGFRSQYNPNVGNADGITDYNIRDPLNDANRPKPFPCKGYPAKDMGTNYGASITTYTQGGEYNMTTFGEATHKGGSSQIALSPGSSPPTLETFRVVKSIIGNCPKEGQAFKFTVPKDTPVGPAIFSWTWLNKVGNREFYQDCASVTIEAGSKQEPDEFPFASRSKIFVANLKDINGCTTQETINVVFPDPGPDLEGSTTGPSGLIGDCGSKAVEPAASKLPPAQLFPAQPTFNTVPVKSLQTVVTPLPSITTSTISNSKAIDPAAGPNPLEGPITVTFTITTVIQVDNVSTDGQVAKLAPVTGTYGLFSTVSLQ